MKRINVKQTEFLEAPTTVYDETCRLVEVFSGAKKSIDVFGREFYLIFYSQPEVMKILAEKAAAGAQIRFLAGPALSVWYRCYDDGRWEFTSGVLDLAEKKIITLYRKARLGIQPAFYIVDGRHFWEDKFYLIGKPIFSTEKRPIESAARKKELLDLFATEIRRADIARNPKKDFVLATLDELASLAGNQEKLYHNMGKDEIIRCIQKYRGFNEQVKLRMAKVLEKYS